jgi:hypothetical protein
MLGTTTVVVMVASMVLWLEELERPKGLLVVIASAAVLYVVGVLGFGRRSDPTRIAWWPFAAAGLAAGSAAELINARFLITGEMAVAAVTGLVIGSAHWFALRTWLHLSRRRAV